ncbi:probable cytochrome P450 305a1 [Schistocerca gregaria]|uniref:probable cytochrome P450 305a1 n=1 Tax=Schistocerca gregaria TaxID=7010 RepID=UPI00211EDF7D|nr:probable cytochrome P450 305a1 [Schistocerca gregaria]
MCVGCTGVSVVYGKLWQEQRAFVMRQLRSLGFSGAAMQAQVGKEVRALLDILNNSRGRPTQLKKVMAPSMLNVILQFCAGYRLPHGDQHLQTLLDLIHARSLAFEMAGGKLSAMPWLRFMQPEASGYNAITKFNEMAWTYLLMIGNHKSLSEEEILLRLEGDLSDLDLDTFDVEEEIENARQQDPTTLDIQFLQGMDLDMVEIVDPQANDEDDVPLASRLLAEPNLTPSHSAQKIQCDTHRDLRCRTKDIEEVDTSCNAFFSDPPGDELTPL